MEYSLFMVKPCAYDKKDEILGIISEKLRILITQDIILGEDFLNKLYADEPDKEFLAINTKQLKGGRACVGIVAGPNAIDDLLDICGRNPRGSMCDISSIRYRYNPTNDVVCVDNRSFFYNAIHRADRGEAVDNVVVFLMEFMREEIAKCGILGDEERASL